MAVFTVAPVSMCVHVCMIIILYTKEASVHMCVQCCMNLTHLTQAREVRSFFSQYLGGTWHSTPEAPLSPYDV